MVWLYILLMRVTMMRGHFEIKSVRLGQVHDECDGPLATGNNDKTPELEVCFRCTLRDDDYAMGVWRDVM